MQRLTTFDKVNRCYVMKPDVQQGLHIQKLGRYEDLEERGAEIGPEPAGTPIGAVPVDWLITEDGYPQCGRCKNIITRGLFTPYCPYCGSQMKILMEVEE